MCLMSKEIFDWLKRERDICFQTIIPSKNTALNKTARIKCVRASKSAGNQARSLVKVSWHRSDTAGWLMQVIIDQSHNAKIKLANQVPWQLYSSRRHKNTENSMESVVRSFSSLHIECSLGLWRPFLLLLNQLKNIPLICKVSLYLSFIVY